MQKKSLPNIARKIMLLMKAKNISQTELAKKTKISRVSFNRFLQSQSELRLSDFLEVLNALDIHLDKIISSKLEDATNDDFNTSSKIGDDIETILNRMPRLGKKSYLGHIIAYADLLGDFAPKPSYKRLKKELELL